jgi:ribose transport system substrate-binding protein
MASGTAVAAVVAGAAVVAAVACAPALAGCGAGAVTPGPSASRRLMLIQGSAAPGVDAAIASGARGEAVRLGYRLTVTTPATSSAGAQISVIDAVIASKPAGVVIAPAEPTALAAPLRSMKSAGIEVVEISTANRLGSEAARRVGVDAVRRAIDRLSSRAAAR